MSPAATGDTLALPPGGPSVTWLGHATALAELGTAKLPEELPDISGSLDALLRISAAGRPGAVARQGSP